MILIVEPRRRSLVILPYGAMAAVESTSVIRGAPNLNPWVTKENYHPNIQAVETPG